MPSGWSFLARRALLYWLGMLAVIFCLSALREVVVRSMTGELPAHFIGTAAALVVIVLLARRFFARTVVTPGESLLVGAFWVALTATFEFGLFHYAMGVPWGTLLADYNILQGRLMGVLMLTTLLAPYAFALRSGTRP